MARPKLTEEQKAENKRIKEHITVTEEIKAKDHDYQPGDFGTGMSPVGGGGIVGATHTGHFIYQPTVAPLHNPNPTVKVVVVHITCEFLNMKTTIGNRDYDIHEFIDGSGRLLIVSKKSKRKLVLGNGNYKVYELI